MEEDFNNERKDREEIASIMSTKHGEWKVREQELNDEICRLQENVDHLESDKESILLRAEQQKRDFNAKLRAKDDHLAKEKETSMVWKEERDEMQIKVNEVTEMCVSKNEKIKFEFARAEEESHMLVQELNGDIEVMKAEKQSLCEQVENLEDNLRQSEENYECKLQDIETSLKTTLQQSVEEKECLIDKLQMMEGHRQRSFTTLQAEKQRVSEGIAITSKLSDDVMNKELIIGQCKKELEVYKNQVLGERGRRLQLERALQESLSKMRDLEIQLHYVQDRLKSDEERHKEEVSHVYV